MGRVLEGISRRRRWVDPLLVAIVMFPVVQLMSAVAESPNVTVDVCQWQGDIPAEVMMQTVPPTCDLVGRKVYSGNAAVTIPPKGYGVAAAAAQSGSQPLDLTVTNSASGEIRVDLEAPPVLGRKVKAAARKADRCADTSYNLGNASKWNAPLAWSFNAGTTPKQMNPSAAAASIQKAAATVASGRNGCGQAADVQAPQTYLGVTSTMPNVSVVGNAITCGDYNTDNTVAFGTLPNGIFGWTCYWWDTTGSMVGADMLLTTNPAMVTKLPKAKKCWNKWDLETIATHEWGHAFGLGHVSPNSKYLTMPPLLIQCDTAQASLGLGDLQGMRTLYQG